MVVIRKPKGGEFLLNLSHDLGVNIACIAIILQMHERLEEINRQMQSFVEYVRQSLVLPDSPAIADCETRRWWRGRGADRQKDKGRPSPRKCAFESCASCRRLSHNRTAAGGPSSPARRPPARDHSSPGTTCRSRSDPAPIPHPKESGLGGHPEASPEVRAEIKESG